MAGVTDKDGRPIILCSLVREYLDVPGIFDLEKTNNTYVVAGFTSNGRVICSDLKVRDGENLEIEDK